MTNLCILITIILWENLCVTQLRAVDAMLLITIANLKVFNEVFNNISQELDIEGNVCGILDENFECVNKNEKQF